MDKYETIKKLGDGTFGVVYKARNKTTGEIVAIKQIKEKKKQWSECVRLPEIRVLKLLSHPNIVKIYEVIKLNNVMYVPMEFMSQNIYQLYQSRSLSEIEIRNIIYQTLQGIAHMHTMGYMHRDMKPENLLELNGIVKIADFGLAKEIKSTKFSDYISTRWYRAPEILLRLKEHGAPIDIWAIGCIMAELYRRKALFPGKNERDMMYLITQMLGSLNGWTNGENGMKKFELNLGKSIAKDLRTEIPRASDDAVDLVRRMIIYDPVKVFSQFSCFVMIFSNRG
jgi:male germ cell-associated kinase